MIWQEQQTNMQRIFRETEGTWQRGLTWKGNSRHHIYMTRQQMRHIPASTRVELVGQVTGMKMGLMITKNKREAGGEAEELPLSCLQEGL